MNGGARSEQLCLADTCHEPKVTVSLFTVSSRVIPLIELTDAVKMDQLDYDDFSLVTHHQGEEC